LNFERTLGKFNFKKEEKGLVPYQIFKKKNRKIRNATIVFTFPVNFEPQLYYGTFINGFESSMILYTGISSIDARLFNRWRYRKAVLIIDMQPVRVLTTTKPPRPKELNEPKPNLTLNNFGLKTNFLENVVAY